MQNPEGESDRQPLRPFFERLRCDSALRLLVYGKAVEWGEPGPAGWGG